MGHGQRSNPNQKLSMQDLARLVGSGQMAPVDRLGQAIRPEQLVLLKTQVDLIFEVVAVTPVLDPRAPMPMAKVSLALQGGGLETHCVLGQPNTNLVVVAVRQQAEEKKPSEDEQDRATPSFEIRRFPSDESPSEVESPSSSTEDERGETARQPSTIIDPTTYKPVI